MHKLCCLSYKNCIQGKNREEYLVVEQFKSVLTLGLVENKPIIYRYLALYTTFLKFCIYWAIQAFSGKIQVSRIPTK